MEDTAVFVFAPGENHIKHLERVFQSIDRSITIKYELCVLLPKKNYSLCSDYPVKVKVINKADLNLCNQIYFQETRTDIPAFATYAQIFIPKYFLEYKKILFMEVDQIVQKDLSQLWKKCIIDDIKIGAVRSRDSNGKLLLPPESFRKIAPNGAYFNMGVALIDTEFWIKNNFTEKCINECKIQKETYGKRFEFYAQGAMNNALHEYVIDLGFEYNVTGLGFKSNYDPSIIKNAFILHWSGPRKPWLTNGFYKELYYSNYGIFSHFIDKTRSYQYVLTKKIKHIHYVFNRILKIIKRPRNSQ